MPSYFWRTFTEYPILKILYTKFYCISSPIYRQVIFINSTTFIGGSIILANKVPSDFAWMIPRAVPVTIVAI